MTWVLKLNYSWQIDRRVHSVAWASISAWNTKAVCNQRPFTSIKFNICLSKVRNQLGRGSDVNLRFETHPDGFFVVLVGLEEAKLTDNKMLEAAETRICEARQSRGSVSRQFSYSMLGNSFKILRSLLSRAYARIKRGREKAMNIIAIVSITPSSQHEGALRVVVWLLCEREKIKAFEFSHANRTH